MIIYDKKTIINSYYTNKKSTLEIITNIIKSNYRLNNINNIKLIDLLLMVQLPYKLNTLYCNTKLNYIDNQYFLNENIGHVIIPTDIMLPHPSVSPIPFSIPYNNNIIHSNVYYYEIYINKIFANNVNISIGFGSKKTELNNILLGWTDSSIGYHSCDGSINTWAQKDKLFKTYTQGDIVGAGIIYESLNIYQVFFTHNGVLYKQISIIEIEDPIIPMIGITHNAVIDINLNTRPFKYDYTRHITPIVLSHI